MKQGLRVLPLRFNGAVCPHKQLWCAVLLQAIEDARGKSQSSSAECLDARNWLTIAVNKWRSILCDYAGVCEESLVKMARERYS